MEEQEARNGAATSEYLAIDKKMAYRRLVEAVDLVMVNWHEQERANLGDNNVEVMFGAAAVVHRQWVLLAAAALGTCDTSDGDWAPLPVSNKDDPHAVFRAYADAMIGLAQEMIESTFAHARALRDGAEGGGDDRQV